MPHVLREGAANRYAGLGQPRGPLALDECEALLHVGLAAEASRRAHVAIEELTKHGNEVELAEATLLAAVADLHRERLDEARRQADEALATFTRQRRKGWSEAAKLLTLRIEAAAGRLEPHHVDDALSLVEAFRTTGHRVQQSHAELLARERSPRRASPMRPCGRLGAYGPCPLGFRSRSHCMQRRSRRRRSNGGRFDDAGAAVDAGVEILERQHLALGATDVRASVTTHAVQLFRVARRMALASGDAALLFDRVEQSRANSLRHRPAALADERSARLLADLRLLTGRLRDETMDAPAGHVGAVADLETERLRLEQELTDHQWQSVGDGRAARSVARAAQVVEALDDQAMAVLAEIDRELVAIVMVDGRIRVVHLGPMQPILDCATGITMTLKRLARHVVSEVRAAAELDLLMKLGRQLEALIVDPRDRCGANLVLVPARLHQIAWCTSPTLGAQRSASSIGDSVDAGGSRRGGRRDPARARLRSTTRGRA